MDKFNLSNFLKTLPLLPGVYRMVGDAGEVLYIGKAKELKKRVSSYFNKKGALSPRIALMISKIVQIEVTVTRTETEALLLENNLIKSQKPKYNIIFRDDKTYPYIMFSASEFPRITAYRGGLGEANQYFGPYPSMAAVRDSVQLLQQVFRLRVCEEAVFRHRSRPCLLYQIKRCSAPCVGLISAEHYQQDVKAARLLLEGKQQEVLQNLTQKMQDYAQKLDFEQAGAIRDRIQSMKLVQEKQFVSNSHSRIDTDVLAVVVEAGLACVNLVMIRGARHLGDKAFFPTNVTGAEAAEILEAFVSQHYAHCPPPPLVVLSHRIADQTLAVFSEASDFSKARFLTAVQGERKVWLQMAQKNAQLALTQRTAASASQDERLSALSEALRCGPNLQRLECFDVSHTAGEATVAACVVYDRRSMQPSEYRRYNIHGVTAGDDLAALRQALTRRYGKLAAAISARERGKLPDLLLIDGGVGQANTAISVLREVGFPDVEVVGVAKGASRKPGQETLILPRQARTLQLAADAPALHLIQQVRDEAHRFAVAGHRAQRGKARTQSTLQEVEGVGAKRRQQLLIRFGGLQRLRTAALEDIATVEGIGPALAARIYQHLHR